MPKGKMVLGWIGQRKLDSVDQAPWGPHKKEGMIGCQQKEIQTRPFCWPNLQDIFMSSSNYLHPGIEVATKLFVNEFEQELCWAPILGFFVFSLRSLCWVTNFI